MVAALPFGGVPCRSPPTDARAPRTRAPPAHGSRNETYGSDARLPDAPVPQVARRVPPDRHAAGPRDARALHGRTRCAAARHADGAVAGHVRGSPSSISGGWPLRQARRGPPSGLRPAGRGVWLFYRLGETFAGAGDRGSDNPLEGIEHLVGVTGTSPLPARCRRYVASLLRVGERELGLLRRRTRPGPGGVLAAAGRLPCASPGAGSPCVHAPRSPWSIRRGPAHFR